MSDLKRQMQEDRALRNAAKALVEADVAHVKNAFSGPSLTERAAAGLSEGAKDVFDKASNAADDHKGILAALVGAVLIWFARNPIMDWLEGGDDDGDDTQSGPDDQASEHTGA